MRNGSEVSPRSQSQETRARHRVETFYPSPCRSVPPLDLISIPSSTTSTTEMNGAIEERNDQDQSSNRGLLKADQRQQQQQQQLLLAHRPQSPAAGTRQQQLLLAHRPQSPAAGARAGSSAAQQLPPACGARQLSKLKRFLTTVQQFSHDLSPLIGQHVRAVILQLVNAEISVEEFHARLQQLTNFPLRPFVIPFMKANLPLLQRELLHCAHLAKQSPHRYMLHNQRHSFTSDQTTVRLPSATNNSLLKIEDKITEIHQSTGSKRPLSGPDERSDTEEEHLRTTDLLHHPHSKHPRNASPLTSPSIEASILRPSIEAAALSSSSDQMRMSEGLTQFEDLLEVEEDLREISKTDGDDYSESANRSRSTANSSIQWQQMTHMVEDLKRVENMLNCVVRMVDKCKETVSELREQCPDNIDSSEFPTATFLLDDTTATDEFMLTSAPKSNPETIVTELTKKDRKDSKTLCWNCGRKASQTCSGCGVARYCRTFCQHKDWNQHQSKCNISDAVRGVGFSSRPSYRIESASTSFPEAMNRDEAQRDCSSSETQTEFVPYETGVPDLLPNSPAVDAVKQEKDNL